MSWPYLSNPCASFYYPLHTVLRVPPAPGLPCALFTEGARYSQNLGHIVPRERFRLFENRINKCAVVPGKRSATRDP